MKDTSDPMAKWIADLGDDQLIALGRAIEEAKDRQHYIRDHWDAARHHFCEAQTSLEVLARSLPQGSPDAEKYLAFAATLDRLILDIHRTVFNLASPEPPDAP